MYVMMFVIDLCMFKFGINIDVTKPFFFNYNFLSNFFQICCTFIKKLINKINRIK